MEGRTYRLLDFPLVLHALSAFAQSAPGKNSCLQIQPLSSQLELESETELLRQALEGLQEVSRHFSGFPELEGLFEHLDQNQVIEEDGLWAIQVVLEQVTQARLKMKALDTQKFPELCSFFEAIPWPAKTEQGLKRCLSSDGELKDESSPELLHIRQELRAIQSQCTKKIDSYLLQNNAAQFLQDQYLTLSADRYVLAVKTNFKGKLQGIIHDYSQTGETCYLEPLSLVELNNRLQELKQEERQAKYKVLQHLSALLRQEQAALSSCYDRLVQLDILQAKTAYAQDFQGISLRPGGSEVCLLQARHPLLLRESKQTKPIDITLKDEHQGLILSGGNAGGKTVALKTLGLIALMALSALPVPIQPDSKLPRWESIHPFFGDEQSLDESLSTFTAQIKHLILDWPQLDGSSLVLLDEFGAGTDPSQGAALAQAVLDHLLLKGAWFMVATHFPALKAYGLGTPGVRAASVLFDPETRKPLYSIAYDQVGQSQALDVAREQGLPSEVLKQAEEYLLLDGEDSGRLLNRLNSLAVARERELQALQQEQDKLAQEKKQWQEEKKRNIKALTEDIQDTARSILREWREGKTSRKQALHKLEHIKEQLRSQQDDGPSQAGKHEKKWTELHPGQTVIYTPWRRNGTVQEKDEKKCRVKLDLGGISIWAGPEELALSQSPPPAGTKGALFHNREEGSAFFLDLRGQRADEAQVSLQRFLDQALLQGREQFTIIHGKGTGALRKAVQDVLDLHRHQISSFHLASEDQGGDGATIVHLS